MKKMSLILAGVILLLSQNTVNSAVTENITENRGYISATVEKTKEVSPKSFISKALDKNCFDSSQYPYPGTGRSWLPAGGSA